MDKTNNPRGQLIETLEDFRYWLTHMEKLGSILKPRIRYELSTLINEALKLEVYEDEKVSFFVDSIDKIFNESSKKQLNSVVGKYDSFLDDSLDYRFDLEEQYGAETAFDEASNDLENYICHLLSPLDTFDENFPKFKQQCFDNLDRAKKIKHENDEVCFQGAWDCLYRVRASILNNNEYFIIKLDKAQKQKWVSKSPYEKFEPQITSIVEKVISGKIKKKVQAQRDIWCLVNGQYEDIDEIKIETLNKYINNLKNTGKIFN